GGGGGGGGSHQNASQGNGGAGGSGIIVIRYLLASEGTGTATTGAVQATGSGGTSVHQTILTDGLYTVYVFDSPGTVNVDFPDGIQEEDTAEILVVGGGGGTGSATSGGGGAGGYIAETGISISDGMTAVIGEGGLAGSGDVGLAGGNSSFAGYTAYGGGYGAAGNNGGGAGGSGGGGGATLMEGSFPTGGSGTSGQGHNGGTGSHSNTGGQYLTPGGGGGAAAVGEGGTGIDGGAGGAGTANDITGTSVTYAAGGHGAGTSGAGSNGTDGRGNGGNGGYTSSGRGGCGCVIIRFLTPMNEGLLTLGSPTATGTGDVHAEYGATGQLNVTGPRVSGVGRHPNVGTGRAELGKVSVLGEAAPFAFLYADGSLTLNVTALLVESMAAAVSVTVAGDEDYGWLHDDIVDASLSAACVLRVAPNLAMMNRSSLPPTDELGLTAAERATPDLRGLRVYLGGKAIQRALIRDLTIVLSDRGGYESATLVLDRSVRKKQYANFSTLRVVYKTVVLFRGRLDGRGPALSDEMVHSLSFTGPIVQLKDHKGFRRVYADSDLSSWQTGQGPNTSANVFDIEAT
ncbi:MAG: glycine-rich domain-containing protein, partial [Armatimonadia bacterium]